MNFLFDFAHLMDLTENIRTKSGRKEVSLNVPSEVFNCLFHFLYLVCVSHSRITQGPIAARLSVRQQLMPSFL